jgi:uncharacterized membrane protein
MADFGPVQVLVIGFEEGNFTGEILDELRRLREHDIVRLVDLLFVTKDENGDILSVEHSDLSTEETAELGAIAGALVGLGAGGEEGAEVGAVLGAAAAEDGLLGDDATWAIADAIEPGTSAAVALIEHRWSIPLRSAILRAGGVPLVDEWVHPVDLVAIGLAESLPEDA